jgi:hypothetical protein
MIMVCRGLAHSPVYQDKIGNQSGKVTINYCPNPQQCNADPSSEALDCFGMDEDGRRPIEGTKDISK